MPISEEYTNNHTYTTADVWTKLVLWSGYEMDGATEVTTCHICGKKHRLCQAYTKDNDTVYVCEQCQWELTDVEYKEYYEDE